MAESACGGNVKRLVSCSMNEVEGGPARPLFSKSETLRPLGPARALATATRIAFITHATPHEIGVNNSS
eukprot:2870619-Prymnesium_polylepis.2